MNLPIGTISPTVDYYTQDPSTVEWGFPAIFIELMNLTGSAAKRIFEWSPGALMTGILAIPIVRAGAAGSALIAVNHESQLNNFDTVLSGLSLTGKVKACIAPNLSGIDEDEEWDAAVTVAPHFNDGDTESVFHDIGWNGRRAFFAACHRHLVPGGRVIMIENILAAKPEVFIEIAEQHGLRAIYSGHELAGREGFYPLIYNNLKSSES